MSGEAGLLASRLSSQSKSSELTLIDQVGMISLKLSIETMHGPIPFPRFSEILAENCEFSHVGYATLT